MQYTFMSVGYCNGSEEMTLTIMPLWDTAHQSKEDSKTTLSLEAAMLVRLPAITAGSGIVFCMN